jgi:hypothetical protein
MRAIELRHAGRSVWAGRLKLRRGANVAAVALANKNAQVLWALLRRGERYRPRGRFSPASPKLVEGTAGGKRLLLTSVAQAVAES